MTKRVVPRGKVLRPTTELDRLRATIAVKDAALREAEAALENGAAQFDFYVEQHMAKTPPDTAKAATNREWAVMFRSARENIKEALK
jgi:hypothetical protein